VSDLETIGGEAALEGIIDDFVDRCFDDVMIGFFFRRANRDRIKRLEHELAVSHLGGDEVYTGRSIQEAHGRHPILGGHFSRRIQLLRETLEEHGVPEDVRVRWIAHDEGQRSLVTGRPDESCNDLAPGENGRENQ
jgi:hemoglobin